MTRIERQHMWQLLALLTGFRDDAEVRQLAATQVDLMLKIDRSRRALNRLVREGLEAAEADRGGRG